MKFNIETEIHFQPLYEHVVKMATQCLSLDLRGLLILLP